ncbi:MAG TPA: DUF58 domain-containing protein [Usitatibacter sp.]|nr:DUF58 domain-containing protein [Usitatibacter sp.]
MRFPVPSRRALRIAGALVAAAIAASWAKDLVIAWQAALALFCTAALADILAARALPANLDLERDVPGSVPIGRWRECVVRVHNRGAYGVRCEVYDHHPAACEVEGLPVTLAIAAGGFAQFRYRLRPTERGDLAIEPAHLRVASPLGLWQLPSRAGPTQVIRCFPDFAELADYALFATDNRLSQIGVLQRRRRGEGLEFHQLRDYREGDAMRQIEWKATARRGRLIAREYEDERDQHIVFLVDCGRRMRARDGSLSHFDQVLNAVLLLAYVALRQGDAAGLMTFASEAPRFVPPRKSRATLNVFLDALYDLQPTLRPPDYHSAAIELSKRLKRRSLVIVLSNMRDEDEETLAPALALLERRHLVLFANLREAVIDELRTGPVADLEDALRYAAGAVYERDRVAALRAVSSSGAILLDTPPAELAFSLVNRYLDLKRSGRV